MSKPFSSEPNASPEQLFTVDQIAQATQQHQETVLRDIYDGRLKALNVSRGKQRPRWRITATEYGRYLVSMMHRV